MHRLLYLVRLLGTVILTDDHTGAGGKTHEKANEHIHNGTHRANRGISLVVHIVANHPGVHRVVQLLEDVADQQGNGKGNDMPGDVSLGHIHIPALARHKSG